MIEITEGIMKAVDSAAAITLRQYGVGKTTTFIIYFDDKLFNPYGKFKTYTTYNRAKEKIKDWVSVLLNSGEGWQTVKAYVDEYDVNFSDTIALVNEVKGKVGVNRLYKQPEYKKLIEEMTDELLRLGKFKIKN